MVHEWLLLLLLLLLLLRDSSAAAGAGLAARRTLLDISLAGCGLWLVGASSACQRGTL
jgi:hypothetical protein